MPDQSEKDSQKSHRRYDKVVAESLDRIMDYFQLGVVFILTVLFGIAVYDLGLKLYQTIMSGGIYDAVNVISILETALLLFLIVEVFRTSVAHLEDLKVLPIVVDVAIIGIIRNLITFRVDKFTEAVDAVYASIAYSALLIVLIAAYYVVHKQERKRIEKHQTDHDD